MKNLILLLLTFAATAAHAAPKYPTDVAAVIERIQDCNHFAGEDPYDEERKKEIASAFKQFKCSALEKDKEVLLKKYKGNGEIIKAIEFAE